ncbi:MAG: Uncharacterised protein [Opitutia bacterium UBA7350]|nr:MAG: Uncharacterised protein [Opitutae bacterium UBA7350]
MFSYSKTSAWLLNPKMLSSENGLFNGAYILTRRLSFPLETDAGCFTETIT